MSTQTMSRRSGATIMARLIVLLGSLSVVMVAAVANGALGFLCAMGVTLMGAVGVAKALGESIALSFEAILAIAVGCGLLRGVLRYVEQYFNHYIAFRLLAVLRDRIFGALRVLCPAKLETKKKGDIIAMITSDIETLEVFYAHTISPICIAVVVSTCVVVFVGLVANWALAAVALVGYLTIGVAVPLVASKRLKNDGVRYRAEFASFNAFFLDSIKGVKELVLYNAGPARVEEVNRRSEALLKDTKRLKRKTTASAAATELLVSVFIVAALVVGMVLVAQGSLSVGRMIIGVVAVFGSFGPVIAISALPGNLTQTFASGERVLRLLEEQPVVTPVETGKDFAFEDLEVAGVSFSYEDEPVLRDVNMHVRRGEIVGIVGESGSGKSTLLKLLLRFWQKEEGAIRYNGIDVDDVDTDCLLENVTMVSQSTYLFDESIADNLRIAKQDATMDEMIDACKMASIHELIQSLPDGYDTEVGVLGDALSAGEKQRIGLARAFLRGSQLILLDEPTSNVDSINEGIILKALKAQKHQRSIILVSHRESTMAIADRIYRIKDGCMTEQGVS